jgi:ABC-2 type transport system ATP-binding protein
MSQPFAPPDRVSNSQVSTMDPPAIEVQGVSRAFGVVQAVRDCTVTAPFGRVTALVGPNGCGKSTLMLMLAALLAPDTGTIRVGGQDPTRNPSAVKAMVGWMPDAFGTWDSLRVREVLQVIGAASFLPRDVVRERSQALMSELICCRWPTSPRACSPAARSSAWAWPAP